MEILTSTIGQYFWVSSPWKLVSSPWKVCLGRLYHFKFFKGCLPKILLGPFLNTLTHMQINDYEVVILEFDKDAFNLRNYWLNGLKN